MQLVDGRRRDVRNGIWASPKQHRDQYTMFSPSLDEMVPPDHRIRRLEDLLLQVDWSKWEAAYGGPQGRPPFHPRLMAGAILYGLTRKIRSTRDLEEATKVRIDFMWFLHAMTIDHSTFAEFRTQFEEELKDLFKQLAVMALKGNIEVELAVDGTRVRANSSRTGALTSKTIERRADCPLAERCLSRKARHRRVSRDQFEPHREELRQRMDTEAAKQIYGRRAPVAEGVFGHIKHGMGIRQFLLRGIDKVRTEWLWICAAHNVSRILASALA